MAVLLLPFNAFALSALQASVDRNPAMENEYLVLTVTADDELESNALDTSALLHDFVVGRTTVSRSTQIVNFDTHKETNWRVLLKAKHQGIVTIPAFEINGVKSEPIDLKVVDGASQPATEESNLFIKASISNNEAYVGQLLTYTIKLYLAVDFQRGVLSTPKADGVQFKQIGDDKDGNEIVNGRRFRVIERNYSMVVDTPGKIEINGPVFSGDILVDAPTRNSMFSFQQSRPMDVHGETLSVNILPKPASYVGNWLVADLVTLDENWQDQQTFEVGQPITRTITLLASNADETSLPDLQLSLPESMKSYPEKPQRKTMARSGQSVAQLTQTVAVVPSKAGEFTLPEVKVAWWNPHLKKQEVATLPARHLKVKAAANAPAPIIDGGPQTASADRGIWPWTTALFALLWLGTVLLWWRARQRPAHVHVHSNVSGGARNKQPHSLDSAIAAQNSGEVLSALLRDLTAFTGREVTLNNLPHIAPELAQTVSDIQAAQYSRQQVDTAALFQQLKAQLASFKSAKQQQKSSDSLMSLNP
ncbi:BatD family protein [Shewanella sp. C32]|uniref:BatD family protein n=1 Tax=Shewanella electrica TaxID=515560 RepID=A0ABT2FKA4_9GAMM|nr:BatD family protein [Shewanella electrica]MCS4556743.1 BatD family protein [Shewanella electrica]